MVRLDADIQGVVGIYIGAGRFIHAVGRGKGVRIGDLHGKRAHRGYLGAVRPKVRLKVTRQAGNAVEHARAVVVRGAGVHHRDPKDGLIL